MDEYKEMYRESITNPDKFWANLARKLLTWEQDFKTTHMGSFAGGDNAWFTEGRLNASYNCIDRHAAKNPDKAAIIYEPNEKDSGQRRIITYGELLRQVSRLAWTLKSMGVRKGDTVAVYMPMIPEALVAVLACVRIGAIHSAVFAGMASMTMKPRLNRKSC
jgi:acetyl-CoA synthetase